MDLKDFESIINPLAKAGPFIGIDMGSRYLKLAYMTKGPGGLKLEDFLVEDISGIEKEERARFTRERLTSFLRQRHIPTGYGVVLCGAENTFSRRITIPRMPVNEIRNALAWEARDILPFPPEEAMTDFHLIGESQNPDGSKSIDLIFMAVNKKAIEEALSLMGGVNLTLDSINTVPGSLINLINYAKELDKDGPIAVVELGHTHTDICVFKDKKLIFTRQLPTGSNDITASMQVKVSTREGTTQLSHEEAERIKEEYGIPQEGQMIDTAEGKLESNRLLSMMRPILEKLTESIRSSFAYIYDKLNEQEVRKIYLTGGGAELKNIDNFIKNELNVATEILSVEEVVSSSPHAAGDEKSSFIIPLISAMAGEGKGVNFLPFDLRKKNVEIIEQISLRLITICLFSVFLLAYLFVSMRYADYKRRERMMQLHKSAIVQLKDYKTDIDNIESMISTIRGNRVEGTLVLKEISVRTPRNILLSEINYSEGGDYLKLRGTIYAGQNEAGAILSQYIKTLENSLFFQSVNLVSSAASSQEEKPIFTFEINCKLERLRQ
jgi:type IV pilus assembly protein PilM